jgi:DNA invertase Pin-like site-specific DNA recombinase
MLGTQADNVRDMREKGREKKRSNPGEDHGMAVLTNEQVREIRSSKETGPAIAKRLGISTTTVYDVRNRKIWKHVE